MDKVTKSPINNHTKGGKVACKNAATKPRNINWRYKISIKKIIFICTFASILSANPYMILKDLNHDSFLLSDWSSKISRQWLVNIKL